MPESASRGGVYLVQGCVSGLGVCVSGPGGAWSGGCVPGPGGVCLVRGWCVCSRGCAWSGGVCAWSGDSVPCGIPPPPPVNRMNDRQV